MIARMNSGFAVMGDFQYFRGYSLLLAYPEVPQLDDLTHAKQLHFLADMARLGEAVKESTGCRRLNYAIYGNIDPYLHAHVWPRYDTEPAEFKSIPPLNIPAYVREAEEYRFDAERHSGLMRKIAAHFSLSQDL